MPLTKEALEKLSDADLLDRIIEEAAEVIHAAMKAKRFGPRDRDTRNPDSLENIVVLSLENVQVGDAVRTYGARYDVNYAMACDTNAAMAREQERRMIKLGYRKGQ